jgi:hypothetical protein
MASRTFTVGSWRDACFPRCFNTAALFPRCINSGPGRLRSIGTFRTFNQDATCATLRIAGRVTVLRSLVPPTSSVCVRRSGFPFPLAGPSARAQRRAWPISSIGVSASSRSSSSSRCIRSLRTRCNRSRACRVDCCELASTGRLNTRSTPAHRARTAPSDGGSRMRRRSRLRRSPLSMAMATLPTPLQRLPRALRGRRHPRGASHGRPGHAARQAGLRFLGWDWWAFGHAPMVPHQSEKKAPKAFASASTAPKKGGEQSIPPWRSDCWSCNGDIFEEEREGVPEQSLSRRNGVAFGSFCRLVFIAANWR